MAADHPAWSVLSTMNPVVIPAEKSWYQPKDLVSPRSESGTGKSVPLSTVSAVVAGLKPINQRRLYVPPRQKEAAIAALRAEGIIP